MDKKIIFLLVLILFLGAFLRFFSITKENYWLDEGFTMITGEKSTFSEVTNSVLFYETAPPLYFYILNIWIKAFGNSPLSTRGLSAIFGVLAIFFIFLSVRKITGDKVALLTSFLSAISMSLIWISQEVRPYSMLVLLAALSTYLLISLYKNPRNINYLFYFVSLLALTYTSYFSVFIIFFQFMALVFTKKYNLLGKIFCIQLISFLLLVPWLIKAFLGYDLRQGIVYELLLYHAGLPQSIAQFGQFALISPLIFLSLTLIVTFLVNLKRPIKLEKIYPLIAMFAVLIFLDYFLLLVNIQVATVRKFFTYSRYFIFLIPFFHFILAQTYFKLKKFNKLFVALILIVSLFALFTYYTTTLKEEWTPSMKFIQNTKDATSGIIFIDEGGANMYLIDYYYDGKMEPIELAWKNKELTLYEIQEYLKDKDFAWLILSRNWKRKEYYKDLFDNNFNLQLQKEFQGIKLYLYETF